MSSYCTLVTPLEAPASRVCVPATVAPLAGRTTLVLGGLLVTVIVTPGLVPLTPPP